MSDDDAAIRRLLSLYAQLLDSRRISDWARLFTQDAEFRYAGQAHRGRQAIEREIGGMQPEHPLKHVSLPPVIDLLDQGHARCWSDFAALTSVDETIRPVTIGRYHDELSKDPRDGRWRFARRVIVLAGEAVPEDVAPTPAC